MSHLWLTAPTELLTSSCFYPCSLQEHTIAIMAGLNIKAQGYKYDLMSTVRGASPCNHLIAKIQGALNTISTQCQNNELSMNAEKTTIVPFIRKQKLLELIQLILCSRAMGFFCRGLGKHYIKSWRRHWGLNQRWLSFEYTRQFWGLE